MVRREFGKSGRGEGSAGRAARTAILPGSPLERKAASGFAVATIHLLIALGPTPPATCDG